MKKPQLSIIIPCYNCSVTLEEAVDSCFKQGMRDGFEIIMVDDGSTDDTKKIMERLAKTHPEIRLVFHKQNKGGGAARNTAVAHANGETIFCLDSDDILPDGTMQHMLAYLTTHQCDAVTVHKSHKFSHNKEKILHTDISPYPGTEIPFSSLLSNDGQFRPLYVNFMYTKKGFEKCGGYPIAHGYDTQGFAWRFMCAGLKVHTCPEASYLHRVQFSNSYFIREYNAGKINYNWRDIFIEHYYVFNEDTLDFILQFNCKDFTRNILTEIVQRKQIFTEDYAQKIGCDFQPLAVYFPKPVYIKRNSIRGFYYRLMQKIFRHSK